MSTANFNVDEFTTLLRSFNSLVSGMPSVEKIKKELLRLKEQADKSVELNYRQKDAIIARCDNYINGTYGKTKAGITFSSPQESKK
jgi:hypothetical protein